MKRLTASAHLLILMTVSAYAQLVSDGGTVVIDGVTNTIGGNLVVGTNSGNTTLILTNSGRVNNVLGTIGQNSGATDNLVQVIGAGSVWSNSSSLTVGNAGTRNALNVTNGGTVFCSMLRIGSALLSGHSNRVHIAGPGSACVAFSSVVVGNGGSGNELIIENGGLLRLIDSAAEWVEIGSSPSSAHNLIHIRGGSLITPTALFISGDPTAGSFGNNQMIIESSGTVTNDYGVLGIRAGGSNNLVTVTGPGSVWHNQNTLSVGHQGNGHRLVISNSALVRADRGFIVGSNGNWNSIVVDGGLFSVAGDASDNLLYHVGQQGSENQLIVTNGGRVEWSATLGPTIGGSGGSNNLLLISGPGSLWLSTNTIAAITVGAGSHNSRLIIENGGQAFFGGNARIAIGSGSNNTAVIKDPGSLLSVAFALGLGNSGNLIISNGGQVIVRNPLTIGNNYPSVLTVSDAHLTVTNASGTGILNVRQGTNVFAGGTIVADRLYLTNGALSIFHFHHGTLRSGATLVSNGSPFVMGDGVNAAVFETPGGIHTFNHGLIISSNATLRGCGTINGSVLNYGTIIAECSGQPLIFSGAVTNYGSILTNSGGALQFNGPVANTIVGISKTGAVAKVTYTSTSGYSFTLEYKDAMNQASWTPILPPLLGTGDPMTSEDSNATVSNRLYRVIGVP